MTMKHSLIVIGSLLAGTLLFGEELDVNGNFMKLNPKDAKQAAGWVKSWDKMKDIGTVTVEKGSKADRNAVRIKTTKLLTPYTNMTEIPAATGREITISFDAKGAGRISDCIYVHGVAPKKEYFGRFQNKNVPVTPEFKRYSFTYKIPAQFITGNVNKGTPGFIRPGICVYADSDILIENVKVDVK